MGQPDDGENNAVFNLVQCGSLACCKLVEQTINLVHRPTNDVDSLSNSFAQVKGVAMIVGMMSQKEVDMWCDLTACSRTIPTAPRNTGARSEKRVNDEGLNAGASACTITRIRATRGARAPTPMCKNGTM